MHSRETRVSAREIKFVTDISTRERIVQWARANLSPDGHGSGVDADEYATSTLYFETPAFDVYQRRGSYGRSKYRARRYGQSNQVFLERKFRTSRLLAKRRTTVPLAELERLNHRPDPTWDGYWFHRRVELRKLRPLLQLSYDRVARVGTSVTGPIRMTIDTNLAALPLPDLTFLHGVGMPFLDGITIIEVKYCLKFPPIFESLLGEFGLQVQKISKFRAGLRALDYPLPPDPAEQKPTPLAVGTDVVGAYAD
jgi:hypothetical protein